MYTEKGIKSRQLFLDLGRCREEVERRCFLDLLFVCVVGKWHKIRKGNTRVKICCRAQLSDAAT